ncbi:MAG: alpha/beta hydrolase [Segetibacter sp.]|nr:alpha/beta hydrolase [Segetibacter sp.]
MKSNSTYKPFKLVATIFIISLSLTFPLFVCAQDNITTHASTSKAAIHEEKFILINGIEQWVTIKGESSKPVILFLHGGPGSPISPYSDALYKEWEKDFIIVQWDQRGTGKTFGSNAPGELTPEFLKSNPLTIEQMTSDGINLSEYLIKNLKKQKIILFGTSWGSVLGVKLASKRPDLFYAYVGHSQIVNPSNDLPLYNKVYHIAEDKHDEEALRILTSVGKPPYDKAKNVGQLFRIVKKYERENSIPAPNTWFVESLNYDNAKDNRNRSDGDDYSFVNYVGDSRLGVESMRNTINFLRDNLVFKIPIYLVQGNEDLLTPRDVTKHYFDKIEAPEKKYFLLPNTAHGFNVSVLETQYKIFKSIKTL